MKQRGGFKRIKNPINNSEFIGLIMINNLR